MPHRPHAKIHEVAGQFPNSHFRSSTLASLRNAELKPVKHERFRDDNYLRPGKFVGMAE